MIIYFLLIHNDFSIKFVNHIRTCPSFLLSTICPFVIVAGVTVVSGCGTISHRRNTLQSSCTLNPLTSSYGKLLYPQLLLSSDTSNCVILFEIVTRSLLQCDTFPLSSSLLSNLLDRV